MTTSPAPSLENAKSLEQQALAAFRRNDWSEAETAAKMFLQAGGDSVGVRRILAMGEEKRGDQQAAVDHLQTALHKFPGDAHAWEQLSKLKWRSGRDAFLTFLRDYPSAYPGLFGKKINYYLIASFYTQFNRNAGLPSVVACAASVMDLPATRDAVRVAIQERDAAPHEHGVEVVEDSRLQKAFRSLMTDPVETIHHVASFMEDPSADHAQLERLLETGPDAGHPAWHVINPHFHLWCVADLEAANAQSRWRQTEVVSKDTPLNDLRSEYSGWLSEQNASTARHVLEGLISGFETPPKILDLGCGKGFWLRYFAEHCGVPVERLRGLELHETRAANARQGLLDAKSGAPRSAMEKTAIARNVVAGDLLDKNFLRDLARESVPDIATLFVVTGCFEDEQLAVLMEGLDALGAAKLVVTSVSKRWDFWHGRGDEDAYFERAGYRLAARHWDPEFLPTADRWQAIAARKYWIDRRVSVYERKRGSRDANSTTTPTNV